MTPYYTEALRAYGADIIEWLLVLREDRGRLLPPDLEQQMRIEGMIKFKYRQREAYLTARGRRCAHLLARAINGPASAPAPEGS